MHLTFIKETKLTDINTFKINGNKDVESVCSYQDHIIVACKSLLCENLTSF